jgi:hypothetical protein
MVAVEYFSKWIKAKPLATITSATVQKFFWQNIICRFDVPKAITVVGPMLRRRRSSRKKRLLAEAVCIRWPKVPIHEASVLQTDLKIE